MPGKASAIKLLEINNDLDQFLLFFLLRLFYNDGAVAASAKFEDGELFPFSKLVYKLYCNRAK